MSNEKAILKQNVENAKERYWSAKQECAFFKDELRKAHDALALYVRKNLPGKKP